MRGLTRRAGDPGAGGQCCYIPGKVRCACDGWGSSHPGGRLLSTMSAWHPSSPRLTPPVGVCIVDGDAEKTGLLDLSATTMVDARGEHKEHGGVGMGAGSQ